MWRPLIIFVVLFGCLALVLWRQKNKNIYEGAKKGASKKKGKTEKQDADHIPGILDLRKAAALTETQCSKGPSDYNNALEKGAAFSDAQLKDRGNVIKSVVMTAFAQCVNTDLRGSESLYKNTCTSAIQAAKKFGDTVDDPQNLRTDMVAQITKDMAPVEASLLRAPQILENNYLHAGAKLLDIKKAVDSQKEQCQIQIDKYTSWQNQLDALGQQPCKAEPSIKLPGQKDVQDSAAANAAALVDILSSLEARIAKINQKISDNKIVIDNTKYSELIIDVTDKTTFDFSLPGTTPVVTVVGSEPQKLKFVLPQGPAGPAGGTGPDGDKYAGVPTRGPRGPRGEDSHFSGLPEQWFSSANYV